MRLFSAVVLVVGAAVCGLPFLSSLSDVQPAELVGALLLYSPYVALAVLARRAKPWAGFLALALLLVGSAVFLLAAYSDAQGGLAAIYVVPAQWIVAVYAGDDRLRTVAPGLRPGR